MYILWKKFRTSSQTFKNKYQGTNVGQKALNHHLADHLSQEAQCKTYLSQSQGNADGNLAQKTGVNLFGEGYSAQGSRIYKIRGNTYSYFYSTIVKETPNDINQLLISYHHLMNYLELLKTYMTWTNLNFNQVTSSHCQPKQLVRQMLSQIMVKSVKSVKKNYASTTLYSAICGKVAGKVIPQKPCLNLSSAFHVREPSWPTNMKLWRVKPSKSPAVPVPHRFLSSFLT